MGYYTSFGGDILIDPPLSPEHIRELDAFVQERHGGNVDPDPDMPGFWCDWRVDESGSVLTAEDGKNYEYTAWLSYLINNFFIPWHHTLNGEIWWDGEESDDKGVLRIADNVIEVCFAVIEYPVAKRYAVGETIQPTTDYAAIRAAIAKTLPPTPAAPTARTGWDQGTQQ